MPKGGAKVCFDEYILHLGNAYHCEAENPREDLIFQECLPAGTVLTPSLSRRQWSALGWRIPCFLMSQLVQSLPLWAVGTVVSGPGIASFLCKPGDFFEVLSALQERMGISEQKLLYPP